MILAADLGGTTIKLGIVRDGAVLSRSRIATEPDRTMIEELEVIAHAWDGMLNQSGWSRQDCRGAALALPFLVDAKASRVFGNFGKFPGAEAVDFSSWARQRLALPMVLENDLRLALLGEWSWGAAKGSRDALMFAFGTGIGCAVICNNRLLRGAHNRAASLFGHSTLDRSAPQGRCGNIGCAEDLASTATLNQRARSRTDFAGSKLATVETINFESLVRFAAEGDPCSRAMLTDSVEVWAMLVQNSVLAYDPDIVVLGGGVMRSPEVVLSVIQTHLRRRIADISLDVPVTAASLGDDAALLGGEVFFQQKDFKLFP
jgi:glucokinase